ncbi:MAG: SH3 domain-containing protein [Bacteriovoracia bacterium]
MIKLLTKTRLVVGLLFLVSTSVFGAQDTTVIKDDTTIYAEPNKTSQVLEYLPMGSEIRISSYPMPGGWYKVRSKTGAYGWVHESFLSVSKLTEEDKQRLADAGVRPNTKSRLAIRGLAGFSFFRPDDLNDIFGFDDLSTGYNFGGEIAYHLSERFAILLRGEFLYKDIFAKEFTSSTLYNVGIRSYPVMVGVDLFFFKLPAFRLSLGLMAGVAIATSFTTEAYSISVPNNTVVLEANPFTSLARINLTRPLGRIFSVFVEGGYRYLKSADLDTSNTASGGVIYVKDYQYKARNIDLSGIVLSAGVGLNF